MSLPAAASVKSVSVRPVSACSVSVDPVSVDPVRPVEYFQEKSFLREYFACGARCFLFCVIFGTLSFAGGCSLFVSTVMPTGRSALQPLAVSPESVVLDIFSVKYPDSQVALNEAVWDQLDEQRIPAETRRRLAQNGLRAGIVTGHIPDELATAMAIQGSHVTEEEKAKGIDLLKNPTVRRSKKHCQLGKRIEIKDSPAYPSVPVFRHQNGESSGKTYQDVQGVYGLTPILDQGQQIILEMVPELHHGRQRAKFSGIDGMMYRSTTQAIEVFDDLRLKVSISAGEMLVLSCLPKSSCNIGQMLHLVEGEQGLQQKLIVIRLAQVPENGMFVAANQDSEPDLWK